MAFDPTTIGKAQSNLPPRIIISGKPKSGKTTWPAKAPNPIYIPVVGEEGCNDIIDENGNRIDVMATPVVHNYDELISVLEWLLDGEHDYKTLVLDSLTTCERMIHGDICKAEGAKSIELAAGGYGKGYTMAMEKFRRITQIISELREKRKMIAVLIAHVMPRSMTDVENNEQYDAFDLALHKKTVSLFEQWADWMVFATQDYYTNNEGKRIQQPMNKLIIHGKAHLPIGGRSIAKLMPKEVDLTWDAFHTAVKSAKTQTNKGE